ncbi:MAG: RNA polymerase sporulation sigma factor SigH [Clostridiales bacterium]|nr:RNA polymerase sporulation sigma factor SigH [Clostridiales bacterium]
MPSEIDNNADLQFAELSDSNIAVLASKGDHDALDYLLIKYKKFAKHKARSYFIAGADNEDIVQEGMIGLYKAIRDFNPDRLASFYSFADLCITRQIITAIKTATRQKHIPLNSYVSLFRPIEEESERTLIDVITKSSDLNPVNIIIDEEEEIEIENKISEMLSQLEHEVFALYMQGKSYQQIAVLLECEVKAIDNALQRIKRKINQYLTKRKIL